MTLIFYRDATGKIRNHQRPPIDWTPEKLQAEMERFNKESDIKAYTQEIKEDSLEFYLYECAQKRLQYTKESIEDALSALDQARDYINSLEVADHA